MKIHRVALPLSWLGVERSGEPGDRGAERRRLGDSSGPRGFRIPHGTAVGIGTAVASHVSHARGRLTAEDFQKILAVMDHLGLPVMDHDFDEQQLLARVRDLTLQHGGRSLHYLLPTAIGKIVFTDTVTDGELLTAVTELRARAGGGR